MESICLTAYAKINIGLDILGRRADGYHEIRTIMQQLPLGDRVCLSKNKAGRIRLRCDTPHIPRDESNLAWRAASLFCRHFGVEESLDIELEKEIPTEAGMGGGSADAAAVLKGMRALYAPETEDARLLELGAALGADVPYCIAGGTALCEGIGEKISPLRGFLRCHALILKPDLQISTRAVYEGLNMREISRKGHADIDALLSCIEAGDLPGLGAKLRNVLEYGVSKAYPLIEELKQALLEHGAAGSSMSGSGSAVFGLFEEPLSALRCREAVEARWGKRIEKSFLAAL